MALRWLRHLARLRLESLLGSCSSKRQHRAGALMGARLRCRRVGGGAAVATPPRAPSAHIPPHQRANSTHAVAKPVRPLGSLSIDDGVRAVMAAMMRNYGCDRQPRNSLSQNDVRSRLGKSLGFFRVDKWGGGGALSRRDGDGARSRESEVDTSLRGGDAMRGGQALIDATAIGTFGCALTIAVLVVRSP